MLGCLSIQFVEMLSSPQAGTKENCVNLQHQRKLSPLPKKGLSPLHHL